MEIKSVVIIGAGFAGLTAAKELSCKKGLEVTLLDKNNHHLFQPLLYQVATASLAAPDIAFATRQIFKDCKNVKTIQAEVDKIEHSNKLVKTTTGQNFKYDYLLVATGSVDNYFNNQSFKNNTFSLKNLNNAIQLRNQILSNLEQAEKSDDPEFIKQAQTFVIIGGGATGVELAGAISELMNNVVFKEFRSINTKNSRIVLIDGNDKLLSSYSNLSSEITKESLEKLGVELILGKRVEEISNNQVIIGDEIIKSATVIWAGGVKSTPVSDWLNYESDNDFDGAIKVNADLSVPNLDNIYIAGDAASFYEGKKRLPGVAQVAIQQGKYFAKKVLTEINYNKFNHNFSYRDRGRMATIGRYHAVAEVGKLKLSGIPAWLLWSVVHIFFLIGFKNRLTVFINWAYEFFTYKRHARLIISPPK